MGFVVVILGTLALVARLLDGSRRQLEIVKKARAEQALAAVSLEELRVKKEAVDRRVAELQVISDAANRIRDKLQRGEFDRECCEALADYLGVDPYEFAAAKEQMGLGGESGERALREFLELSAKKLKERE